MFRRLTALYIFVVLMFSLPAYAAKTSSGDVIVVLKNQTGIRVSAVGGVKNHSTVKAFTKSANVRIKQTYDSLSETGENIFMVVHSDTKTGKALLEEIRSMPGVVGASLNRQVHIMGTREPNDPDYYRLWGMQAIHAPEVWEKYTGSYDVYAAVIYTGIDPNHEDLKDNIALEYCRNFVGYGTSGYDENHIADGYDHGSHCAGTIAAVGNNNIGVAGVNWKVKIIALRVLGDDGLGDDSDTIAAINYVVKLLNDNPDMKIASVNMSLGSFYGDTPEEMKELNAPYWLALKTLSDTNRTVICVSAGNEASEVGAPATENNEEEGYYKGDYCYPASFTGIDNMIVVSAAKSDLTRIFFSNYSSKYVDVAAPGVNIFSTVRTNAVSDSGYDEISRPQAYDNKSGTSMAAPHVTGAAALLKSIYPNATASQIKAAILGGADSNYLSG